MLLDVFDYGTPAFRTLNSEFRRRVVEEAAASGADAVITGNWGSDLALLVKAANEAGCDELWSEDFAADTELRGVRIVNPFAE